MWRWFSWPACCGPKFRNPSTPTSEKSRTMPYNRLFGGLEERRRQMRSPWLRLNCMDIHQGLALFIVDFEKFGYGPMACHAWKCVQSWCVPFEKKGVSTCNLFRACLWGKTREKQNNPNRVPSLYAWVDLVNVTAEKATVRQVHSYIIYDHGQ